MWIDKRRRVRMIDGFESSRFVSKFAPSLILIPGYIRGKFEAEEDAYFIKFYRLELLI